MARKNTGLQLQAAATASVSSLLFATGCRKEMIARIVRAGELRTSPGVADFGGGETGEAQQARENDSNNNAEV
ncbi:MAG: hypothetical protein KJ795_08880 [Gammaproteobacteria bacterium]|nr:hypothetical protein [Gammaproteobacteria bacterium]MBU1776080.1 hypothetical protein [Gammaproteobacteria bacterium]MBU1970104.1 hypothetical protein [Gammaproteobacteria bacterium]